MAEAVVVPSSSSASLRADATVLLVEDDPGLVTVLSAALSARVRRVEVATTGAEALEAASLHEPDVVILDLGLPDVDGVQVCRQLRRWFHNPILVVTADGAEGRKVEALDEGANDYVTKPFSMPELLARVRVALRHRQFVAAVVDDRVLEVGALQVDTGAHQVTVDGEPVSLAPKEYALLVALARMPGRLVTHGALRAAVWGDGSTRTESLRVHVAGVRRKLGAGPDVPVIVSEPGVGYRLVAAD